MYVSAARGYVRSVANNDNEECVSVTAANILDFMSARAKSERILLVLLQYLQLVHETELLYKAEKNADVELFLVALKHILLACCVSHSTGYVSLLSDFFVGWTCASPALKNLYERAILFRKLSMGRIFFSDRLMEWLVRDVQLFVGKRIVGSIDSHLDTVRAVSLHLKEDLNLKAINRKEKKLMIERKKPIHGLTKIFCEILVYCEESNLIGPGKIKRLDSKPYLKRRKSMVEEDDDELFSSSQLFSISGEPLYTESMFTLSTSIEQDQDYFECYCIDTDDIIATVRSEKRVE